MMNYASTNRDPDNDYPDMTNDDVADMVCGKQPAASVERLEDLAPIYRDVMIEIAGGDADIDIDLWEYLFERGLVDYCNDDTYADTLTERGASLVRDYQRRQVYGNMTPAEIAEYDASQDSLWEANHEHGEGRGAALRNDPEYLQACLDAQKADFDMLYHDYEIFRDASFDKDKQVVVLRTEKQALEAELQAAREQLQEACVWLQNISSGNHAAGVYPHHIARMALNKVEALKASGK